MESPAPTQAAGQRRIHHRVLPEFLLCALFGSVLHKLFWRYPAIGSVNAARQNYNFVMLPDSSSSFGSCDMQIENRKAQPPVRARGEVARTYLYMEDVYPRYSMSKSQRQLMNAWDKQYPVTGFECRRASVIEQVQGNANPVMRQRCGQL